LTDACARDASATITTTTTTAAKNVQIIVTLNFVQIGPSTAEY